MLTQIDYQLFIFLNTAFSNPSFDVIVHWMTNSTNLLIIYFSVSAIHIAFSKHKVLAVKRFLIASALLGLMDWVGHNVIKEIFDRPRPNNIAYFVDGVHILFPQCNFFGTSNAFLSFPSNHALTNMAVATIWSFWFPKMAKFLIPFALFIGFTRIYVGVHFPLDIFFGLVFGFGFGWLTYFFTKRWVCNI
jgi:undecaprenyl-diphosphatase